MDNLLTPLMVAEAVGRSRRTVTNWIERGWLRASRANNGWYWFVSSNDLDRFVNTCRNQSGDYLPQLWETELADVWEQTADEASEAA
jgi:hypothetical protein